MSDKQKTAVLSIVLSAVVALLSVFGYNVIVVQPQMEALSQQVHVMELAVVRLAVEAP